jgi:hypothetical protein
VRIKSLLETIFSVVIVLVYADDPVTTGGPVWDAFASTCRGAITGCPAMKRGMTNRERACA